MKTVFESMLATNAETQATSNPDIFSVVRTGFYIPLHTEHPFIIDESHGAAKHISLEKPYTQPWEIDKAIHSVLGDSVIEKMAVLMADSLYFSPNHIQMYFPNGTPGVVMVNPNSEQVTVYGLGRIISVYKGRESITKDIALPTTISFRKMIELLGVDNRLFYHRVVNGVFRGEKNLILWLAKKYMPGSGFGELMRMFGYVDKNKAMEAFVSALKKQEDNYREGVLYDLFDYAEHGKKDEHLIRRLFASVDNTPKEVEQVTTDSKLSDGTVVDFEMTGAVPLLKNGDNWVVSFNTNAALSPWYEKFIVEKHGGYWCIGASQEHFATYSNRYPMLTFFMDGELYEIIAGHDHVEFQDYRNKNTAREIIYTKALKIFGNGFGHALVEQYTKKKGKFSWKVNDTDYKALPATIKGASIKNYEASRLSNIIVKDALEALSGGDSDLSHGLDEYAPIFQAIRDGVDDKFVKYFAKNEGKLATMLFQKAIEIDKETNDEWREALMQYLRYVSPYVNRNHEAPAMKKLLNSCLAGEIVLPQLVVPDAIVDTIKKQFDAVPSKFLFSLFYQNAGRNHDIYCPSYMWRNIRLASSVYGMGVKLLDSSEREVLGIIPVSYNPDGDEYRNGSRIKLSEAQVDEYLAVEAALHKVVAHGLRPGLFALPEFHRILNYTDLEVSITSPHLTEEIPATEYIFYVLRNSFMVTELRPNGKTVFQLA